MKVKALTPDQARSNEDQLVDVEVEATVAKINCILARCYSGATVQVSRDIIDLGLGPTATATVLQRFIDQGWNVKSDSYTSFFDGGRHYIYIFSLNHEN